MEGVNRRDFLYARRIFDPAELNETKPIQRAGRAIMGFAALRADTISMTMIGPSGLAKSRQPIAG